MQIPSNNMLLSQMASGYAPIASGLPPQLMTGFEGVPGFNGGGMSGMFMQMAVAPYLQQMMGQQGYMPLGFSHDINAHDVLRHQQFRQEQQQVMQQMADLDRDNYLRSFRGLAAMTGTPYGAQQRRAARQLADTASSMSPLLSEMFPELIDQLGGQKGSATVLARKVMEAGRYQIDPVTGQMGYSTGSAAALSRDIYQDLYSQENLPNMRGIAAGDLGTLYDEMSRRGLVQRTGGTQRQRTLSALTAMNETAQSQLQGIADKQGISLPKNLADLNSTELDKLRLDPQVEAKLRSFDSEKIKRSLQSYTSALSAIRSVFGDAGRPDAPIQELLAGLEAITQGAVGRVDPSRLNMMVRTTQELAKQSGMSIDGAMILQQHAASRSEQLGISPLHAIQAAQGSMAWGSAYKATGGGATAAWERMSADQMQQLDVNLRMQAASSEMAQRQAVIMRVRDSVGGFQQGSQMEAFATAVAAGQTEYLDPTTNKIKSTAIGGSELTDLMTGAKGRDGQALNINEGTMYSMLDQRRTNEEYIEKYGIAGQVRKMQAGDVKGYLSQRYAEATEQRLRASGMDTKQARELSQVAGENIALRVSKMTDESFADRRTRTDEIAEIMEQEISAAGGTDFIKEKRLGKDFFQLSAESSYGYIDRAVQTGQYKGFRSFQNLQAMMNPATQEQASRNATQARFAAEISDAMAPLGQGTMLRRAMQYLQNAGPDADLGKFLSESVGGVAVADMNKALDTPMNNVKKRESFLKELQQKYMDAADVKDKAALLEQIETQQIALRTEVGDLTKTAEQFGIFTDTSGKAITPERAQTALESLRTLAASQQDLAGLSGDFAHKISPQELKAYQNRVISDPTLARDIMYTRERENIKNVSDAEVKKYYESNQDKFSSVKAAKKYLEEARTYALEQDYKAGQGYFADDAVKEFMGNTAITGDTEARKAILLDRSRVSLIPTAEEIKTYADAKSISLQEAETQLSTKARAKRFGISEDEISKAQEKSWFAGPKHTETQAIQKIIEERMLQQLDVSKDDVLAYRKNNTAYALSSVEEVTQQIRQERQKEAAARWETYKGTDSGMAAREQVQQSLDAVDDYITGVVSTPAALRKMGPQAIQHFKAMRGAQQRLNELAAYYTGGDKLDLLQGNLTGITDPVEMENVRNEVFAIQSGMYKSVGTMKTLQEEKGRNWGDPTQTARALLGYSEEKVLTSEELGKLSLTQKSIMIAGKLQEEDFTEIANYKNTQKYLTERAKSLNVSPEALADMLNSGVLPEAVKPAEIRYMQERYKQHVEQRKALDTKAEDMGLTGVADLLSGYDVITSMDQLGKDTLKNDATSVSDLLQESFTLADLDVPSHMDLISKLVNEQRITGETGAGFTRQFNEASRALSGVGKRLEKSVLEEMKTSAGAYPAGREKIIARAEALRGKDAIVAGEVYDIYAEAKKTKKLDDFRKQAGLLDDKRWGTMQEALEFYGKSGLEKLDDLPTDKRAAHLSNMLQEISVEQKYKEAATQNTGSERMTIDGTLRIIGETGDINAEAPRSR